MDLHHLLHPCFPSPSIHIPAWVPLLLLLLLQRRRKKSHLCLCSMPKIGVFSPFVSLLFCFNFRWFPKVSSCAFYREKKISFLSLFHASNGVFFIHWVSPCCCVSTSIDIPSWLLVLQIEKEKVSSFSLFLLFEHLLLSSIFRFVLSFKWSVFMWSGTSFEAQHGLWNQCLLCILLAFFLQLLGFSAAAAAAEAKHWWILCLWFPGKNGCHGVYFHPSFIFFCLFMERCCLWCQTRENHSICGFWNWPFRFYAWEHHWQAH